MKELNRNNKGLWVWAGFEQIYNNQIINYQNIINLTLKGPKFYPHLTLSGPIKESKDLVLKNFLSLKYIINRIDISCTDIILTNNFYTSIYIDIYKSKYLDAIKEVVDEKFGLKNYNNFNPHISLFYGKRNLEKKRFAIKNLKIIPKKITIDRFYLVYVDEDKENWIIEKTIYLD